MWKYILSFDPSPHPLCEQLGVLQVPAMQCFLDYEGSSALAFLLYDLSHGFGGFNAIGFPARNEPRLLNVLEMIHLHLQTSPIPIPREFKATVLLVLLSQVIVASYTYTGKLVN